MQGLFLIDAPCPGTIPPLSQDTIQLLDRLGVITSKELQPQPRPQLQQQWRRPGREESIRAHFMGTIQALKTYNPLSTREDDAYDAPPPPKCLTLWASDGVWETIEKAKGAAAAASMRVAIEDDHDTATPAHRWIMEKRTTTDLGGGGGWEALLPRVEVEVVSGDHFTIMRSPQNHCMRSRLATVQTGRQRPAIVPCLGRCRLAEESSEEMSTTANGSTFRRLQRSDSLKRMSEEAYSRSGSGKH